MFDPLFSVFEVPENFAATLHSHYVSVYIGEGSKIPSDGAASERGGLI